MRGLIAAAVLACTASCTLAASSSTFSAADKEAMVGFLTAGQKADGSFGSVADTYHAFEAFKVLHKKTPNKKKLCASTAAATEAAISGEKVESLAMGVTVLASFGCKQKASDEAAAAVVAALEAEEMSELFFAVSAGVALSKAGHAGAPTAEQLNAALVLAEESWDDSVDEAAKNAGYGFKLAALLSSIAMSPEGETARDSIADKVESVMELAEPDGEALQFLDEDSEEDKSANVRTTTFVLGAIADIAAATQKALTIDADAMNKFAEFVMANRAGTAMEACYFASAMNLFTSPYATNPIVLRVLPHKPLSMSSTGKAATVKVQVTDVTGQPIGGATVALAKATYMAGEDDEETALETASAYSSVGGGVYAINFLSLIAPHHGLYTLETSVKPSSSKYAGIGSAKSTYKVMTTMEVSDFQISSKKSGAHKASGVQALSYPAKAAPIALDFTDTLSIELKVRSADDSSYLHPHQVFARLRKGSRSVTLVATTDEDDDDLLLISLSVEDAMEAKFKNEAGEYALTLMVGDFYAGNSVTWALGTVTLTFPETAVAAEPAVELFGPWPTLEHTFQTPDSRAPSIVSTLFTLAVLAPFAWLYTQYSKLGFANLDLFPSDMPEQAYAGVFHGSLGLMLYLLFSFWLATPMLTTLYRLAPVAGVALLSGQKALTAHGEAAAKPKPKTE